jgi:hypothetical protein
VVGDEVEMKEEEVGKNGCIFIELSAKFVNQNDTSRLVEGDNSTDTVNKFRDGIFSTTDEVDNATTTCLQHKVVNESDPEAIEENEVQRELDGEEETQESV